MKKLTIVAFNFKIFQVFTFLSSAAKVDQCRKPVRHDCRMLATRYGLAWYTIGAIKFPLETCQAKKQIQASDCFSRVELWAESWPLFGENSDSPKMPF